ncbi:hypothetical protein F5882DRAFT_78772 [Hyaloscypha sp. PMI_1271]|nr:hypothetical protein F5882DRAFT_78772 [Hyaloscypha sp. PMI_1271]
MSTQPPYHIETSGERDLLTSALPEILVKIIVLVPSKHYLDLVHTNKALRNFMKLNASSICNEAIWSRFPVEAKVLRSELEAGWLVPTHEKVAEEEENFRQKLNTIQTSNNDQRFSLLGKLLTDTTVSIKLTSPGPQYLYFLEHNILRLSTPGELFVRRDALPCSEVLLPGGALVWEMCEVVIDGRKHLFDFHQRTARGLTAWRYQPFYLFMRSFNMVLVKVKNRKFVRRDRWNRTQFPRELVWFYGVERLKIVKEGEVADWKTLPMLPWQ